MHKVTSVNLNGRAYQLEQTAYEVLQAYLAQAQAKLADSPDKEEVMQDFEQAIAEKCDQVLVAHKNVVTGKEMDTIIAAMGPVEVIEVDGQTESTPHDHPQATQKRLYTLPKEGVIGGVCSGLAAYLNVDVTIIRVVFVILGFLTSGFWVLVYLIMLVVVPEAKTPEQKAELRGERFTAQDLLDRAKKKYAEVSEGEDWKNVAHKATPALTNTGNAVLQVLRGTAGVLVIIASIFFGIITAAWAVAMWTVLLGNLQLTDQLSTIAPLTIAIGLTSIYLLLLVPLWGIGDGLRRFARHGSAKVSTTAQITAVTLWTISFAALMCVMATVSGRVADYQRTHAYLYANDQRICINSDRCVQEDHRLRIER